ncbi:hypothetical protein AAFF_G00418670 [Aldrovandia affinis]|uniref:Uncharacterized protein n=1 Tax=Aldrovandia affinis TaxID=143900 RepID=A0AAD7VYA0_9TELE|nr:hypothetical protein AAFF_G00418670 [Aldrovandia affinis]
MPDGALSFGVLSIPGASAAELRTEVLNVVLPRTPEAVCLLGPSNNLCSSRTVSEAGADFGKLLKSVCGTWPSGKVFVLDFPSRLNIDVALQDLLRQEYHRVAARMDVRYVSVADHFPLTRLDLWCRDGVHLSDDAGMEILARLVWAAASQQLERATRVATVQRTSPRTSPPARRVSPKVVVMDEVAVPRPSNPFEWTVVGRTTKTAQPETPPPAPSPWTKKDAITPSQSPAQKMARLPIAALAAPVVGRTKKVMDCTTLGYCAVDFDVFIGFVFLDSPARDAATSPFIITTCQKSLPKSGCDGRGRRATSIQPF